VARADTSNQVVTMTCVPAARLLQIESTNVHDNAAARPARAADRRASLARDDFYDAHQLASSRVLGEVVTFRNDCDHRA